MLKHIKQDLENYRGDWVVQGFWVMLVYRFGQWRHTINHVLLRKLCSLIYKALYKLTQIITGIELPCEAVVGDNFLIDHFGGIYDSIT